MFCCADEEGSTKRQELIVVASLLDKAPNLAGLSRTCEVPVPSPTSTTSYQP